MTLEPIIVPAHPVEPAVQVAADGATQPAPTAQQQRLAEAAMLPPYV